jgi:hypothetical protein
MLATSNTFKVGFWTQLASNLSNALSAVSKTGRNVSCLTRWPIRYLLTQIIWRRHHQLSELVLDPIR